MATERRRLTERELGDRWATLVRERGGFVVKVPASSLAGLPDWLVAEPGLGLRVTEAKRLLPSGEWAFEPERSDLRLSQRVLLERIARFGGTACVLILGPESWLEVLVVSGVEPVDRETFERLAQPYMGDR